ncbi:N-acetyllactosaminide beta-1,3-N-acetylglucosaminyltransferase 3-like [Chanos chanos]|uniref:Hexosyltransferase n=1 Tax=Chanos chanos TaxID=29144 RepID=A0A6J2WLE3_CHACN|nr:N-acetyllactosaminide beta-1,3-N-acetylglucosaminyltransferase 3-like [Chanos chanos]
MLRIPEITLFSIVCTMCLIVVLLRDNPTSDIAPDDDVTYVEMSNMSRKHPVTLQKQSKTFQQLSQPCERNESAASISGFSKLPEHIRDFLFYRHCRHFPMLLDVPDKCGGPQGSADVFFLLVIKSTPTNFDRREVLRKTWAKERRHNGVWVRRVFISGTVGTHHEKRRMNRLLKLENEEHRDILQWDFRDTFFNLTLKQILFLEWMEKRCPNVRFLMNGDDDVFANTDNMVEYLQSLPGNDGSKHLYVGHLIHSLGPIRYQGSKYYVPKEIHEVNYYPPYCGGGGFLISGFTARIMYNMSHSITIMPIDDVYLGMCVEKAGLKPESHSGVRTFGMSIPSRKVDALSPCFYREILLVHRFLPYQIFVMWNDIHKPNLRCGTSVLNYDSKP